MNSQNSALILIVSFAMFACSKTDAPVALVEDSRAHDYFSFANTAQFVTEHLGLNLTVDFDTEQLHGSTTLHLSRIAATAAEIILDTRDLTIEGASFVLDSGEAVAVEHHFGETDAVLGTPLIISVPPELESAAQLVLKIDYRSSPAATALQWLLR